MLQQGVNLKLLGYSAPISQPILHSVSNLNYLMRKLVLSLYCLNQYICVALRWPALALSVGPCDKASIQVFLFTRMSINDSTGNQLLITQLILSSFAHCTRCMDKKFTQSLFDLVYIQGVYVFNAQLLLTCQMVHTISTSINVHERCLCIECTILPNLPMARIIITMIFRL